MTRKLYIGVKPGFIGELFRSPVTPTEATHGTTYRYAFGPYRTIADAERAMRWMDMRHA